MQRPSFTPPPPGTSPGTSTVFHHPLSDGNPDAIVLVTQSWNPRWRRRRLQRPSDRRLVHRVVDWSIFNQDGAAMPVGRFLQRDRSWTRPFSATGSSRETSRPGRRSCQWPPFGRKRKATTCDDSSRCLSSPERPWRRPRVGGAERAGPRIAGRAGSHRHERREEEQ